MPTRYKIRVTSKSFPLVVVTNSVEYGLTVGMPATRSVILQIYFMNLADVERFVGKAALMTITVEGFVIICRNVSVHVLW